MAKMTRTPKATTLEWMIKMLRDVAVARVKQLLGFRLDQDANIVQAMQEVQAELEREPELPDFLRVTYTGLVTAANTRTVPVPNDFIREWEQDQMTVTDADGGVHEVVKDELGYNRIRYTDPSVGVPAKYSLVNKQFYFFPMPDQVYALDGTYYAHDQVLTSNIENKWLSEIPEILIGGAGVLLAAGLRDKDAIQLFASIYSGARTKVGMVQAANDQAGSKPVMGGEDN